jgi:predicted DNA-binding transcriptional regulator AlpA
MEKVKEIRNRNRDAGNQEYLEFLKLRQVCNRIGFGKSWLWDAIKDKEKRFPAPIRVGGSVRWVSEQVEQWMRERIERNQSGQGA